MTSFTVPSGKAELAVTTWGTTGSPVLALHPGVGDRRIWQWCAPVWAEAGHRVVAYDRRGFGDTVYEAEPHDDLADLLAVTAATDARPAVIVGNSRGGGLALDLVLAHPDHVTALVLIAPSPSGYPSDEWIVVPAEAEQDARIEQAEEAGDLAAVNRLEVHYWLDGVAQVEGRVQGSARALMIDMNGRALAAEPVGEASQRQPAWPRLAQIDVPVLVVSGEHDLPGVGLMCAQLAAALPNAQSTTIAGTAHCPALDESDALNRAVLEFVASIG